MDEVRAQIAQRDELMRYSREIGQTHVTRVMGDNLKALHGNPLWTHDSIVLETNPPQIDVWHAPADTDQVQAALRAANFRILRSPYEP